MYMSISLKKISSPNNDPYKCDKNGYYTKSLAIIIVSRLYLILNLFINILIAFIILKLTKK